MVVKVNRYTKLTEYCVEALIDNYFKLAGFLASFILLLLFFGKILLKQVIGFAVSRRSVSYVNVWCEETDVLQIIVY